MASIYAISPAVYRWVSPDMRSYVGSTMYSGCSRSELNSAEQRHIWRLGSWLPEYGYNVRTPIKFKGVQKRGCNRYLAFVWLPKSTASPGRRKCFGSFATAEEAARTYDMSAIKVYGARVVLNFPEHRKFYFLTNAADWLCEADEEMV